jgi:hypothetical protein
VIDLGRKQDINRLYTAINASRDALLPFRRNRIEMLREFVGSYYSDQGAQHEVLCNLLNLTADVYTIGLAARNPKVRVATEYQELWPFAYRYQQGLNNYIKEIRFEKTLQQAVLDAFFSYGICKVFMASWESIQLEDDVWADPGRPYIKRISPDDFGMDMFAKHVRECKFVWDEYRVSWDSLNADSDYDKKIVKKLAPNSKYDRSEEKAQDISQGSLIDGDELEPMVDLMDVWLPGLNKVGVFSRHVEAGPLKLVEAGPEGGPYHLLSFSDVPDSLPPSSPAQNLMGLHKLYNGLLRKQAKQAKRQKTNPVFRPHAADDAERLQRFGDGEWVKTNDPKGVSVITQGGVDQTSVAFSIGVMDLFDRAAGNLKAMAGLGPQAPTASQEEMIYAASSKKEAKMRHRVDDFVAGLMGAMGHLMWADQFLEVKGSVESVPGSGFRADYSWTPEMREGDWWQYNFEIEPYSTNYEPPEFKAQKMERLIQQVTALYPLLQQNGGSVDVQALIRYYAEAQNLPELENIVTFMMPLQDRPGPAGQTSHMPANTTRSYVRHNVPTGGTPEARSENLQQAFLRSGSMTPDQAGSLTR